MKYKNNILKSTFIRNETLEKNEKSLEYRIVIAAIQHSANSITGHRILRWSRRENGKSSLLSEFWASSSSDKRSDVLFLQKILMKNKKKMELVSYKAVVYFM